MAGIKHFPPPSGIKAPPLSFAARTGDLLFISGIPGFDPQGSLPDGFEVQFANVVTNIKRILDEAGATMRDLVKVNVLLTRASDVAAMNVLYASAFGPAPSGDLSPDENAAAYGEVVWSWRRDRGVKPRGKSHVVTVARNAAHRGEHV